MEVKDYPEHLKIPMDYDFSNKNVNFKEYE